MHQRQSLGVPRSRKICNGGKRIEMILTTLLLGDVLNHRSEEDTIGPLSSTGSKAVVQGGARQRRSALDEILILFREFGRGPV